MIRKALVPPLSDQEINEERDSAIGDSHGHDQGMGCAGFEVLLPIGELGARK